MTKISKIIEDGKGLVYLPFIFKYSTKISGVSEREFQNSAGRSISLFRALKFFSYDGVVNELNPDVSIKASGSMGASELDLENMRKIPEVALAVGTTEKLAQMLRNEHCELMGVTFGVQYLTKSYSTPVKQLDLLVDNLTNLERLYIEAGCTSLTIVESDPSDEVIEAYSAFNNVASSYGAVTLLLDLKESLHIVDKAKNAGFTFVSYPAEHSSEITNPCLMVELHDLTIGSPKLGLIEKTKEKTPAIVIHSRDPSIPTDPNIILSSVKALKS